MYNRQLGAAFMEIFNNSSFAFDLSGWRSMDWATVSRRKRSRRTSGSRCWRRTLAYAGAYGTNAPAPFGIFDGNLDADGETSPCSSLACRARPTSSSQVRYVAAPALGANANGGGASLH